jgi:hypothetical protein
VANNAVFCSRFAMRNAGRCAPRQLALAPPARLRVASAPPAGRRLQKSAISARRFRFAIDDAPVHQRLPIRPPKLPRARCRTPQLHNCSNTGPSVRPYGVMR